MNAHRLIIPAVAFGLVLVCGCTKNPQAPAQVSGTVTFNNQPLRGGTIIFHDKESRAYSAAINEEGGYVLSDLPIGEMAVTVETESLNPKNESPTYGGARAKGQVADYNPPGAPPKPDPKSEKQRLYVKIPARYGDPKSSQLSTTLKKGKNTAKFDLTD